MIENLEHALQQFSGVLSHARYCLADATSAAVCDPFWKMLTLTGLILLLLVVLVVSYKLMRIQLEYLRNQKRLDAQKAIADPEVMKQHVWTADNVAEDISQEELAALIRKNKANTRTETA